MSNWNEEAVGMTDEEQAEWRELMAEEGGSTSDEDLAKGLEEGGETAGDSDYDDDGGAVEDPGPVKTSLPMDRGLTWHQVESIFRFGSGFSRLPSSAREKLVSTFPRKVDDHPVAVAHGLYKSPGLAGTIRSVASMASVTGSASAPTLTPEEVAQMSQEEIVSRFAAIQNAQSASLAAAMEFEGFLREVDNSTRQLVARVVSAFAPGGDPIVWRANKDVATFRHEIVSALEEAQGSGDLNDLHEVAGLLEIWPS